MSAAEIILIVIFVLFVVYSIFDHLTMKKKYKQRQIPTCMLVNAEKDIRIGHILNLFRIDDWIVIVGWIRRKGKNIPEGQMKLYFCLPTDLNISIVRFLEFTDLRTKKVSKHE
jgi:hypothetical protein